MSLIACICEGGFERAVMDLLLDQDCLIFTRDDLLEGEVLRCRDAKSFQMKYLNKTMDEKVRVYRILDSRRENFKITGPYRERVEVVNVITSPEIEMLIIHSENRYDDYSRKKMKPSDYVKQHLRISNVKSYKFVQEYFADVEKLKNAIEIYHSKTMHKQNTLFSLIK